MTDGPDDGVLGNLPRSRPGTRSAKRNPPEQERAKRERPRAPAGAARPEPVRSVRRAQEPEPQPSSDIVDLGLRAAEAWAGIVLFWPRVAVHVTTAVLRRLPRLF